MVYSTPGLQRKSGEISFDEKNCMLIIIDRNAADRRKGK